MTDRTNHVSQQRGFSMVELMVAIVVSLLLMTGTIQIFANNKQTYRVQEALSRLQENGRFAVNLLTKDIRMAGFAGCGDIGVATNIADVDGDGVPDQAGDVSTAGIDGREEAGLPVAITDTVQLTAADVYDGTDVILIKRGSDTGVRLVGNMTADNANIQLDAVTAAGLFAPDDILVISDCEDTDVFAANNVSSGSGKITITHSNSVNINNKLSKAYGADASVMKMESFVYYIGINASGGPSLYRKRLSNVNVVTEELIEGVEDMEILYGEDTNGDQTADTYISAASVTNMVDVVSVRLTLTLRTLDDNVSLTAGGGDNRIRRTFSSTITIRNRVS